MRGTEILGALRGVLGWKIVLQRVGLNPTEYLHFTVTEQSCKPARGLQVMHTGDFCIVVAEDNDLLRYCTVHLLETQGYRVIEARDGQEALDLVDKCNDRVHLLITNHDMPRVNGSELARRLREKNKKLVVLLISGGDQLLAGTTDFEVLPKPYNEAELTHKVRELLRRGLAVVGG